MRTLDLNCARQRCSPTMVRGLARFVYASLQSQADKPGLNQPFVVCGLIIRQKRLEAERQCKVGSELHVVHGPGHHLLVATEVGRAATCRGRVASFNVSISAGSGVAYGVFGVDIKREMDVGLARFWNKSIGCAL